MTTQKQKILDWVLGFRPGDRVWTRHAAQETGVSTSYTSTVLKQLEKLGYLESKGSEFRTHVRVRTEKMAGGE